MTLTLDQAFEQARSLEMAYKNSETYNQIYPSSAAVDKPIEVDQPQLNAINNKNKCFFCGLNKHPRSSCPAKDSTCNNCGKIGHYARVCKSKPSTNGSSAAMQSYSPTLATIPSNKNSNGYVTLLLNNKEILALVDSGSTSSSFIDKSLVHQLNMKVIPSEGEISLANSSLKTKITGECLINFTLDHRTYENVEVLIMENLCADIILGQDFMERHKSVVFTFNGKEPTLQVCALTPMKVPPPSLFMHLSSDCKPIAVKSRRHTKDEEEFIKKETQRLLNEGIIKPSKSPWRAQVLVTKETEKHKKRMVIDYSQTINRYTELDAYPLPRIDDMVSKISKYSVFSTLDLKSAYHQIPLPEEDKIYTAFEATSKLYEFNTLPFGLTNGVAAFQRSLDNVIEENNLEDTFAYVDNITVCGMNQEEHDINLKALYETAKKRNMTFNPSKSIISTTSIKLLGYVISQGSIKPDPDRLKPLQNLPAPNTLAEQRRIVGMFAYYSKWISKFSDKIRPLTQNNVFPLPENALHAFQNLKVEIENAVVSTIDETIPFEVENDASDFAIAATLNQAGKPVAFFSRSLSETERRHSAVEKEAYAIVESIRAWKHYLQGRYFKLITDQRSVAFMYNSSSSKIKNDKIMRWRVELSSYKYDIVYRPGKENKGADPFSRIQCSAISSNIYLKRIT